MKRHWPLLVTLLCWALIFAYPVTRHSVLPGGRNRNIEFPLDDCKKVDVEPFTDLSLGDAALLRKFPHRKEVLLYVARQNPSTFNYADLDRLYPRDAFVVRLQLEEILRNTRGTPFRNTTNKAKPLTASEQEEQIKWLQATRLARRGMALEPQNTFFDWQLIFALLALNRGFEARQALHIAAGKTVFDSHDRDANLNNLAYLHLIHESPLKPEELRSVRVAGTLGTESEFAALWITEMVLADRKAGRHSLALQSTLDLLNLARLRRLHGYSLFDSGTASNITTRTLFLLTSGPGRGLPLIVYGPTLATAHSDSSSLYSYARSQGRRDVMAQFDQEWKATHQWRWVQKWMIDGYIEGVSQNQTAVLVAAQRFRFIALETLLSTAFSALVFWLLSRRFRTQESRESLGWRAVLMAVFLLVALCVCDLTLSLSMNFGAPMQSWTEIYVTTPGLQLIAEAWAFWGAAAAMLCYAVHRATVWQRQVDKPDAKLVLRFKQAFSEPEDRLAPFDFGWMFGLVGRLTLWLAFLITLLLITLNFSGELRDNPAAVAAVWTVLCLALHFWAWRSHRRRRETLRLSLRYIAEAMTTFFVVTSIAFTLVAFASLPLAYRFEAKTEEALQSGDIAAARMHFGLPG